MSDSQLQARLFQAPAEIRQAIYALLVPAIVHIFRRQETLCLSRCVTPSPYRDDNGFERRSPTGADYRDEMWRSRLRSLWGPHWKCEQVASSRDGHADVTPLLLVCRQMYEDVADCLSEIATFHIADISTLEHLLRMEPNLTSSKNLVTTIFYSIRKLYITARLQLQVCKAIEGVIEDLEAKESAALWRRVWPAIINLNNLRKLEVEVDHTNPASWSVASERAIISPLALLGALPQLELTIILPKLHPFYENPERQFTEDSAGLSFTIIRRTRQQYHAVENPKADYRALFVTKSCYDHFPMLPAVYALTAAHFGHNKSPEEIEKEERAAWKSGTDIHLLLLHGEKCYFCNGQLQ